MATVKEIKKFLETLNEDEELFIGYSDEEETRCELWTKADIIERANDKTGIWEGNEEIEDIDTALQELFDFDEDYHFSLIEI